MESGEAPPISLEDLSAAALTISGAEGLAARAAHFLALVGTWATPSAVLCLRRSGAEGGWSVIEELTTAHGWRGQEASFARLVEESAPGPLTGPTCIRPSQGFAGVNIKPRDSWVIPWTAGAASGYLLLRGIAPPYPTNLAAAVALLAPQLWLALPDQTVRDTPAPASPVEGMAEEIEELAGKLRDVVQRAQGQQPEGSADLDRLRTELQEQRERAEAAEGERDKARREAQEQREASAGSADGSDVAALEAECKRERTAASEARAQLEAQQKELEEERRRHQEEHDALKADLERQKAAAEAQRKESAAAQTKLSEEKQALEAELDRERTAAREAREAGNDTQARIRLEAERDEALEARRKVDSRVKELETELRDAEGRLADAEKASADDKAGAAELERARRRITDLQKKIEVLERAATEAEGERAQLRSQTAEARAQTEALKATLEAERVRAEADRLGLEAARQAVQAGESLLAQRKAELESAQRQRTAAEEQLAEAEKGKAAAESERDRARSEASPLWGTIESLQRQIQTETQRRERDASALSEAQRATQQARQELADLRTAATSEQGAVQKRAEEAEGKVRQLESAREEVLGAVQGALVALRRTPFVPPTLRIAFGTTESALGLGKDQPDSKGERPARILFLDRDTPGVEIQAETLEERGVEVLIAHYPEEVGFFLKTPDARRLTAVVGDVMAFRSDMDLLERFSSWRLEAPKVVLIVSFRGDDAAESERARRLPPVLGAGQIKRPIALDPLLAAITSLQRKSAPKR